MFIHIDQRQRLLMPLGGWAIVHDLSRPCNGGAVLNIYQVWKGCGPLTSGYHIPIVMPQPSTVPYGLFLVMWYSVLNVVGCNREHYPWSDNDHMDVWLRWLATG